MGLNILVVDDSATIRAMINKTLQMSGLPIGCLYQAANGKDALDILDREQIDVVLVDINMPVMGGLEMIDRIHEHPPRSNPTIVVVSTESSETRIKEIHRKGAVFVHKPFTPEQISKILHEVSGRRDNCE